MNFASRADFEYFMRAMLGIRQGNLVLMDNGNLRLIWKDDKGTHLGLQFLGEKRIQFVIFKRRSGSEQITRVAGRDTLANLEHLIAAFDLWSLLFE